MPLPSLPDLPSSVPSGTDLDVLAQRVRDRVARRSAVIPWTYGRDRVEGRLCVFYVDEANGFYYMAFAFCVGPINQYEKIFIDGVDINTPTTGFIARYAGLGGAVNSYTGTTTQNPDPLLSAAIAGYADNLRGYAYVVIKFPIGSISGWPAVDALIQGLKLYDSRLDDTNGGSGAHRLNDPSTWTYSDTPALAHADFLVRAGWPLSWPDVVSVANANEAMIGSPAEKRRIIGLTLTTPQDVPTWNTAFRAHAGSIMFWEDGVLRMVPDQKDVDGPHQLEFLLGSSKHVDFGTASRTFTDGMADRVFECWFTVGATGTRQAILDAAKYYIEFGSDNKVMFGIRGSDAAFHEAKDPTARALGDRVHISGVYKASTHVKLFINGVEVASTAHATTIDDAYLTPKNMFVGRSERTPGFYLTGKVDDVRVWSAARTGANILADYLKELVGNESNLLAYWRFNEGSGVTAVDLTASPMNGTLVNSPMWVDGVEVIVPYGVIHHFTDDDVVEGTMTLVKRGIREAPTVMTVEYEDHTGNTWFPDTQTSERGGVETGDIPRRESRISLAGVHRASQAKREATERLNKLINDLSGQFECFDVGAKVVPGSIIQISHSIGLSYKLARVLRCREDAGRYQISFDEYDPAAYSDEVIANPTYPDTNLGNPLSPPQVVNATLVEELYTQKNGDVSSRLRVAWDTVKYPYLSQITVEGYVGGTLVFVGSTTSSALLITGVEELVSAAPVSYTVKIFVESAFRRGEEVQKTVTVNGKFAVPGDVPSVNAVQSGANKVRATWSKAVDIDIWRYEVRQGTPGQTWDQGVFKQLVDGLEFEFNGLVLGSYRVMVKALDSVRNYSANMAYADVTVARPSNVASITGYEVAGEVRLAWAEATGYVVNYKVSYGPSGGGGPIIVLDKVNALRLITKDVPVGTWRFYVVAVDDAGNESATAAYVEFAVSSDGDAFLADSHDFITPSLTNMSLWEIEDGDILKKYYVTSSATSFTDTSFTDFSADELANYHASVSSEWLSETKDFGVQLTGTFLAEYPGVSVLNGSMTKTLELSTNGSTWDTFATSSAKGTYRYARIRLTATTTSTFQVITPLGVSIKVTVVPVEESGSSTSLTSGPKTITLAGTYSFTKEITVTPIGSAPMTGIVDNIVMGNPSTFDVYVFDPYNQKLAASFRWQFKGV